MASLKFNRSVRLNGINPLAYIGQNSYTPNDYVIYQRDPTVNDWQDFYVGCIWLNQIYPPTGGPTGTFNVWMLVGKQGNQAKWIQFAGGSGAVVSLKAQDNNFAFPVAGTVRVIGAGPLTTTADNINTLTVNLSGSVATSYPTDAGTAIPAAGVLNVFGGTAGRNTNTTGAGNTIHVELNNAIILGDLANIAAGNNAITINTGNITFVATNGVGNLNMGTTNTAATAGVITFGGNRHISAYGTGNIFVGNLAGNTTLNVGLGALNSALGNISLSSLTTGTLNTAVGALSLIQCTTGSSNTACGAGVLGALTTGSGNIGVGSSCNSTTTGIGNIVLGDGALDLITTGSYNIIMGINSGDAYTGAESSNINLSNNGIVGESNTIRIGTSGAGSQQQNRCFIAGIRGITTGVNDAIAVLIDSAGQLGTVSSTIKIKENVHDMGSASNDILKLRPVIFNYIHDENKNLQFGLIAEEVAETFPRLAVIKSNGECETVKYQDLITLLLNELQKLVKRVECLEKNLSRG